VGGINEAGLVVEVLLLPETVYPEPDTRPAISMLQWVQYQLDNFSSTREVIESDGRLRILSSAMAPGMHYFVCDKTGHCASIEFLEGKQVVHTREEMPVKVLANSTYKLSFDRYRKTKKKPVGRQNGFPTRFGKAADMVKSFNPKASTSSVAYAFEILKSVAQGSFTQWRIVYDIQSLTVYFMTTSNREIRRINLRSFDFSCTSPVKVLDINGDLSGDVSGAFVDYTEEINRIMIEDSFRNTPFLATMPGDLLRELSRYPETNTCLLPK
jgi:penicillin V acylase-like amidase (Ntn superfamily)